MGVSYHVSGRFASGICGKYYLKILAKRSLATESSARLRFAQPQPKKDGVVLIIYDGFRAKPKKESPSARLFDLFKHPPAEAR
jgi:hypothetical protein